MSNTWRYLLNKQNLDNNRTELKRWVRYNNKYTHHNRIQNRNTCFVIQYVFNEIKQIYVYMYKYLKYWIIVRWVIGSPRARTRKMRPLRPAVPTLEFPRATISVYIYIYTSIYLTWHCGSNDGCARPFRSANREAHVTIAETHSPFMSGGMNIYILYIYTYLQSIVVATMVR